MLVFSAIRAQAASRIATRGFSATAKNSKDMLQDLYLKEIRNYKPDPKAAKAEVTTKNFVAPKVPEAPKNDIKLESDIKAYEQSGVVSIA